MKIYFLTFGGPSDDYHDAVKRLHNQAIEFNMFTKIYSYTEKDLMEDTEFFDKNSGCRFSRFKPSTCRVGMVSPFSAKKIRTRRGFMALVMS